jgi:SAM-dependent methyltransferase
MNALSAFDALAAGYDAGFTASAIGQRMRAATWRRIDANFAPGQRILELNCGTGEVAVHLARRGVRVHATDCSEAMLDVTRAKVAGAGLAGLIHTAPLAIEDLARHRGAEFDGALSNFGGLNCVADLRAVARGLAHALRPGARAVLCIMGPVVPWEWAWFLARRQPCKAFRRLQPGGTSWRELAVRYPAIPSVRRAFSPHFVERRLSAVGALVPPSYAEAWAARHPRLLESLDRWERCLETFLPLPWLADHYLLELERRRDATSSVSGVRLAA